MLKMGVRKEGLDVLLVFLLFPGILQATHQMGGRRVQFASFHDYLMSLSSYDSLVSDQGQETASSTFNIQNTAPSLNGSTSIRKEPTPLDGNGSPFEAELPQNERKLAASSKNQAVDTAIADGILSLDDGQIDEQANRTETTLGPINDTEKSDVHDNGRETAAAASSSSSFILQTLLDDEDVDVGSGEQATVTEEEIVDPTQEVTNLKAEVEDFKPEVLTDRPEMQEQQTEEDVDLSDALRRDVEEEAEAELEDIPEPQVQEEDISSTKFAKTEVQEHGEEDTVHVSDIEAQNDTSAIIMGRGVKAKLRELDLKEEDDNRDAEQVEETAEKEDEDLYEVVENTSDILGYFRDVPRRLWSCCMLGKLAGEKGFHCHAGFYAAKINERNTNRAHNNKMLFHGKNHNPHWGRDIMVTFEKCITDHADQFHKCCYASAIEKRERYKWHFYRHLIGSRVEEESQVGPISELDNVPSESAQMQLGLTPEIEKLQAGSWTYFVNEPIRTQGNKRHRRNRKRAHSKRRRNGRKHKNT